MNRVLAPGFALLVLTTVCFSADKPRGPAREDGVRPGSAGGALVFHEKSKTPLPAGYKLLYEQSFDDESALSQFVMTDPAAWKWATEKGGALELVQQSQYTPAVRSPFNIALIADRVFGDFILEADLIQTGKEYGHRDMCLFFGFQNPTNFYYAHIATAADEHAHNIFIVKNQPRTRIAKETTHGVNWGLNAWHKVRLERNTFAGTIKVYFDDLSKPIMVASDKTFGPGCVGFGSFDDTGKVDNIRIWGPSAETKKTDFFPRPRAAP
ncbi:MAG: hypothetical protein DME18_03320 [Verrucomicrobia bacterium]|nr:MAG: hypothetical protein DME18_03320 [Verrucomicrobiota bacterium]